MSAPIPVWDLTALYPALDSPALAGALDKIGRASCRERV